MPTEVVMPQMGESIAEGTIVRWLKRVGDRVERDEPLFEISTDKVDAEIPSPIAGIIAEIRAKEGETVPVNSVVAVIGAQATSTAAAPPAPASAPAPGPAPASAATAAPSYETTPAAAATASVADHQARPVPSQPPASGSIEEVIRQRSSPLVRKIAQEHNIDISTIRGTGLAGRVTKDDILAHLQKGQASALQDVGRVISAFAEGYGGPPKLARASGGWSDTAAHGVPGTVAPMSVMRKKIAEHMVASRRTSAHVHSVFEVNFGRVAQIREARKREYDQAGAKLTYLSFLIKAAAAALKAVPVVNASVDGESIVYHEHVNIGIAVALDWGLIVPVVRDADVKSLIELSRAVADLAARARTKQLKPDEVSGGTFTITNPGVFGALVGMPIINQPQVAILGFGHVEKRPVVIDDAIGIRPMAYLSLGYDHRIIDGAVADEFMSHVKRTIEGWDPSKD